MMKTFLAVSLAASMIAFAQRNDDAPLPYGDDDSGTESKDSRRAKKSRRHTELREDEEDEKAGEKSLASLDDPNIGIGGEVVSGLALLGSSKAGVDARIFIGARFTWEFGRLLSDEYLREMFFADLTWLYTPGKEGTAQVNVATYLHNFTIAPAVALPLGKSFMAAYAQLGVGMDYSYSVTTIDALPYTLGGTKFLFQYGIGLRGRPAVVASGAVRISFRIELTRFVRGYMHDTYLAAGVGMIF